MNEILKWYDAVILYSTVGSRKLTGPVKIEMKKKNSSPFQDFLSFLSFFLSFLLLLQSFPFTFPSLSLPNPLLRPLLHPLNLSLLFMAQPSIDSFPDPSSLLVDSTLHHDSLSTSLAHSNSIHTTSKLLDSHPSDPLESLPIQSTPAVGAQWNVIRLPSSVDLHRYCSFFFFLGWGKLILMSSLLSYLGILLPEFHSLTFGVQSLTFSLAWLVTWSGIIIFFGKGRKGGS